MLDTKTLVSKAGRLLFSLPASSSSQEAKQRRLMVIALGLLVASLVTVLYHDRDFWFPDTQQAEDNQEATPAASSVSQANRQVPAIRKKAHLRTAQLNASAQDADSIPPVLVTADRTVLPPLEIEVVAGDEHRHIQANDTAVRLDTQPESATLEGTDPAFGVGDSASEITNEAVERADVAADTSQVVSHPVTPDYPLLARQMKVQGSVILLALISRDGLIQDLRILSGPPILSEAAREAVRQWHFKPHYEGTDAVETVAKVTVNFTISTN
jgi:TonB family protein